MSTINQALSQLAKAQDSAIEDIEQVTVTPIKSRPAWVWVLAGFCLSLALGGWAVSAQNKSTREDMTASYAQSSPVLEKEQESTVSPGPTQKSVVTTTAVYAPHTHAAQTSPETEELTTSPSSDPVTHKLVSDTPATPVITKTTTIEQSPQVTIEQVELTPEQLAQAAEARAQKSLDSNDFDGAVAGYAEALRYTPKDELLRQKLAALYYGKNDVRRAFDLLQTGIEMDHDGERLRIALSRMLIKEKQMRAALTPLSPVSEGASIEYLSLRAALAQKNQLNTMALESYQMLVAKDPNNARWWLGLAIQQERSAKLQDAKLSYQQALSKVGVSSRSMAFIQDRLNILAQSQGGASHAN
ncbi:tetratricopeptide repeat protein [Vibrio nitrifigilis]|uniref:MSHA biogenesis protein MshN n=1 Tax=Vibrio nitrifigilis TaxID=2789781 RepID=A0ABS0GG06_9VIBR|nr:MSHA biogenesis protein MshN [Vibrio nitrifigilis]MBF9001351.1 MSHA biogenesis protein MshN [Vibrio nitrifigilis]